MTKIGTRAVVSISVIVAVVTFLPASSMANDLRVLSDRPGSSGASEGVLDVLFDQSAACDGAGPASQLFPDFANAVLRSADDFTVPAGEEWAIASVYATGAFFNANPDNGPILNVIVQFWTDAGGLPDSLICEEVGTNVDVEPNVRLNLSGACTAPFPLAAGTYWVSIVVEMPYAPSGQWGWSSNNSANGAEFAFQDPDSLIGNPCVTWGHGITDCGIGAPYPDLCFGLEGMIVPVELMSFRIE